MTIEDRGGERAIDERAAEAARAAHDRAVYIISVAAELAGVHPQTLRIYERKGLVRPQRTSGNTRRYSQADIERLQTIQSLTEEGINLAGVKRIIELQREIDALEDRIDGLETQLARRAIPMPGRRISAAIVPMRTSGRFPWEDLR